MKITEVRFTLGYTYNLGDYSNIRPEVTLTAEVDGDASNALNELYTLSDVLELNKVKEVKPIEKIKSIEGYEGDGRNFGIDAMFMSKINEIIDHLADVEKLNAEKKD